MVAERKPGHIVREFMIENTKVKICDDYCRDRTQEEINAVLERIAENAFNEFRAAVIRDKQKEKQREEQQQEGQKGKQKQKEQE